MSSVRYDGGTKSRGGIDMKPTATDIEDFVRDLFHWLYIDYAHCVGYASPDDENDFSPNLIEKHGKLQKKTLDRAAKSLGLPIEALMQLDGREISSWMMKYPYFKLRSEFEKELEKNWRSFATAHAWPSTGSSKPSWVIKYTTMMFFRFSTITAMYIKGCWNCFGKWIKKYQGHSTKVLPCRD